MPLNFIDCITKELIIEPVKLFDTDPVFEKSTIEEVFLKGDKKHPLTRQEFTSNNIVMDESFIEDFKKQRRLYLQLKEGSKSNHTNGQILWQAFFIEEPYLLPQDKNNNNGKDPKNEIARMEILLNSGVDINNPINEKQDTALLNAIQSNDTELVNFLLVKNAELKIEYILWAKILNYSDIETILINHHNKNSPDKLDNKTIDKEVSEKYLNNTFDILSTILSTAAEKKHLELIQYYLSTSPFNSLILSDNSQMNNARLSIFTALSKVPQDDREKNYAFVLKSILPQISLALVLQKEDTALLMNVLKFFSTEKCKKNHSEILNQFKNVTNFENKILLEKIIFFLPLLHFQFKIPLTKIYDQEKNSISLALLFSQYGLADECILLYKENPDNEQLHAQLLEGLENNQQWGESHFYLFSTLCEQPQFLEKFYDQCCVLSLNLAYSGKYKNLDFLLRQLKKIADSSSDEKKLSQFNFTCFNIPDLFNKQMQLNEGHKEILRLLMNLGFAPDTAIIDAKKNDKSSVDSILQRISYNFSTPDNVIVATKKNEIAVPSVLQRMILHDFSTEDLKNALQKVKPENHSSAYSQILQILLDKDGNEDKDYILSICHWLLNQKIQPEQEFLSLSILKVLTTHGFFDKMVEIFKFCTEERSTLFYNQILEALSTSHSEIQELNQHHSKFLIWLLKERGVSPIKKLSPHSPSMLSIIVDHGLFKEMKIALSKISENQLNEVYEIILNSLYRTIFEKNHLDILNWLFEKDVSPIRRYAGISIMKLIAKQAIVVNLDNILEELSPSDIPISKNTLKPLSHKEIAYDELLAGLMEVNNFNFEIHMFEKHMPVIQLLLSSNEQHAEKTLHLIIQKGNLQLVLDHILTSSLVILYPIKKNIEIILTEAHCSNISNDKIHTHLANTIKDSKLIKITPLSQDSIQLLKETLALLNGENNKKRNNTKLSENPYFSFKKTKTEAEAEQTNTKQTSPGTVNF